MQGSFYLDIYIHRATWHTCFGISWVYVAHPDSGARSKILVLWCDVLNVSLAECCGAGVLWCCSAVVLESCGAGVLECCGAGVLWCWSAVVQECLAL